MVRTIIAIAAFYLPSAASAAPVYLACTFEDAAPLTATADESQSIVTVMVEGTPAPQRFDAAFTPDEVTFGNRAVSYRLDRSTLALIRKVYAMRWTQKGQCKLQKVSKRAF